MPALMAEFFERDLSEAEDEALQAQLREDPEAAARFAQLAAEDYRSLGLPIPRRGSPWRAWKAVAFALAGAGAAWAWQAQAPEGTAVQTVPVQDHGLRLAEAGAQPAQAPASPGTGAVLLVRRRAQGGFEIGLKPLPAGALKAQVLSESGAWSRDLAPAGAGTWAWDGTTQDGSLAPAGRYRLVLSQGGRQWRRWVQIEHH